MFDKVGFARWEASMETIIWVVGLVVWLACFPLGVRMGDLVPRNDSCGMSFDNRFTGCMVC